MTKSDQTYTFWIKMTIVHTPEIKEVKQLETSHRRLPGQYLVAYKWSKVPPDRQNWHFLIKKVIFHTLEIKEVKKAEKNIAEGFRGRT